MLAAHSCGEPAGDDEIAGEYSESAWLNCSRNGRRQKEKRDMGHVRLQGSRKFLLLSGSRAPECVLLKFVCPFHHLAHLHSSHMTSASAPFLVLVKTQFAVSA